MTASANKQKLPLLERGLRWDIRFNRGIGIIAVGAAGVATVAGASAAAGYAALFAGGNFLAAEVEKRAADGMAKRRLGKTALKPNVAT